MGPRHGCTCGARAPKKPVDRLKTMEAGDVLIREGQEYIVAQVNPDNLQLINLANGNRWSDSLLTLSEIRKSARRDGFAFDRVADAR